MDGYKLVVSTARSNKLYCSDPKCKTKYIRKGSEVLFVFEYGSMKECYCSTCGSSTIEDIRVQELHDDAMHAAYNDHGQY